MSAWPSVIPPELAVWLWGESALLAGHALAQTFPPTSFIARDPFDHLTGVLLLGMGVANLKLARIRATGGRRLAVRVSAFYLLTLGAAYSLGDRFLRLIDAVWVSARPSSVAGASVGLALCGLGLWRSSPLRGR